MRLSLMCACAALSIASSAKAQSTQFTFVPYLESSPEQSEQEDVNAVIKACVWRADTDMADMKQRSSLIIYPPGVSEEQYRARMIFDCITRDLSIPRDNRKIKS